MIALQKTFFTQTPHSEWKLYAKQSSVKNATRANNISAQSDPNVSRHHFDDNSHSPAFPPSAKLRRENE
jgi:hypothetical protein